MQKELDILVTLDENYMAQLRVLLTSIYLNHPGLSCRIFLLHRHLPGHVLRNLQDTLAHIGYSLYPVEVDGSLFEKAPVTKQYPQEMYYRLLAARFLPDDLDRILYLDPDILVIHSLLPLWETDLDGYLFAAAAHTGKTELANSVNRIRLGTDQDYFNSGVLLINLEACRREIHPEEIFSFVSAHEAELLLPDQDILNALYYDRILPLDDALWNYDARNYSNYLVRSLGEADMDWVMHHTSILHFCGRDKPWKKGYRRRFGILYRHYMHLADLYLPSQVTAPPGSGKCC